MRTLRIHSFPLSFLMLLALGAGCQAKPAANSTPLL